MIDEPVQRLDEGALRALVPRVLAGLVRRGEDFDAAEDALQEALLEALRVWPEHPPRDPRAWLTTVATRRLVDAHRSEVARRRREETTYAEPRPTATEEGDDTLFLLFCCCHPDLAPASQVALTLRAAGGLTTREIADAFYVPEATMAQRISRAKRTLRGRRLDQPGEAIRLARQLTLATEEPEASGSRTKTGSGLSGAWRRVAHRRMIRRGQWQRCPSRHELRVTLWDVGWLRWAIGWRSRSMQCQGPTHSDVGRDVPSAAPYRCSSVERCGFEAVVFDFDGLLMDTESTLVQGWRAEWAFHGLSLDLDDDFWPSHGGDVTAHRLNRLGALVGPTFDRAASRARFLAYREHMHRSMDLCPGIRNWLSEARALGVACAVASSSPLPWVQEHLSRVGAFDLFDVIATGNEVPAPKPDPAVYQLVLDRLGVTASSAVAVEDTPHGVDAAGAAGMVIVAIPNPFVDVRRVATADVVLSSAADLPLADVFARLLRRHRATAGW